MQHSRLPFEKAWRPPNALSAVTAANRSGRLAQPSQAEDASRASPGKAVLPATTRSPRAGSTFTGFRIPCPSSIAYPEPFRCYRFMRALPSIRRAFSCAPPSGVVHFLNGHREPVLTLSNKNIHRMHPSCFLNHRSSNPIKNNESLFGVLHFFSWDYKNGCAEFRYLLFPFPPQATYFLLAGSCIRLI